MTTICSANLECTWWLDESLMTIIMLYPIVKNRWIKPIRGRLSLQPVLCTADNNLLWCWCTQPIRVHHAHYTLHCNTRHDVGKGRFHAANCTPSYSAKTMQCREAICWGCVCVLLCILWWCLRWWGLLLLLLPLNKTRRIVVKLGQTPNSPTTEPSKTESAEAFVSADNWIISRFV